MHVNIHMQIAYAEQELTMYRVALPQMVKDRKCPAKMAAFRLAAGEAIVNSLRLLTPPDGRLTDALPLVCYFATTEERQQFIDAYKAFKEGGK